MDSRLFDESDNDSMDSYVMVDVEGAEPNVKQMEQDQPTQPVEQKNPPHERIPATSETAIIALESDLLASLASHDRAEEALLSLLAQETPFTLLTLGSVAKTLCEKLLAEQQQTELALQTLRHLLCTAGRMFVTAEQRQLDVPAVMTMLLRMLQKNNPIAQQSTCIDCCAQLIEVASDETNLQVCQWIIQRVVLQHHDENNVAVGRSAFAWLSRAARCSADPQLWDAMMKGSYCYKDLFWKEDVWGRNALLDAVELLMTLASKPALGKEKEDIEVHSYRSRVWQNGIDGILRWQEKYPGDEQVQLFCVVLYGNISIHPHLAQDMAIMTLGKHIVPPLRRYSTNIESEVRRVALGAMFNMLQGSVSVLVIDHSELIASTIHHILAAAPKERSEEVTTAFRVVRRMSKHLPWHFHPETFTLLLEQVIFAMQQYPDDLALHRICMFVVNKSAISKLYNTYLLDNALEVIFSSVNTHIADTDELLGMALPALNLLACTGGDRVTGGIPLCVQLVQLHVDHPIVVTNALSVLFELSTQSEDARATMRRQGILSLLDTVLKRFGDCCEEKSRVDGEKEGTKAKSHESKAAKNATLLRRNLAPSTI